MFCCDVVVGEKIVRHYIQPSEVNYNVEINGSFSCCELVQTFELNETEDIFECEYKFPMDFNSAIYGLTIQTPRETIEGVLKEKSEAQKTYVEAKKAGKQVFIAREYENDPDVCSLKFANIYGNDKLVIRYRYITENSYAGSNGVFYIPTFISPRYNTTYNTQYVKVASKVNCKIVVNECLESFQVQTPNMMIRPDIENKRITFEYHSTGPIEKDIEIVYNIDLTTKSFKFESKGHTFAMTRFMPRITFQKVEKEIVFVLDCSGSMSGERIENASKAILHCIELMKCDSSSDCYRFTIIRYGSTVVPVSRRLIRSSDEEKMKEMVELCKNLSADLGGTETLSALKIAFELGKKVLLITDGDTSDNDMLHEFCKNFTVLNVLGIGSGINRDNIEKMARSGNGMALYNQGGTDTTNNVEMLFNALINPPINDFVTNLDLGQPIVNPQSLTGSVTVPVNVNKNIQTNYPIIPNQFNTVYGLIDGNPYIGELRIKAKNSQCAIDESFPFSSPPDKSSFFSLKDYMGCLIAKRLIQHNPNLDKEMVVELGCCFNIITRFTQFVAVSDHVTEIKEPKYSLQEKRINECMTGGGYNSYRSQIMSLSASASASANASASAGANVLNNLGCSFDLMENSMCLEDDKDEECLEDDEDEEYFDEGINNLPKIDQTKRVIVKKTNSNKKPIEYDQLIADHFDTKTQFFNPSVIPIFQVPNEYHKSPKLLTLYVILMVKVNYSESEYKQVIELVADNYSIVQYNQFCTMNMDQLTKYVKSCVQSTISC